MRLRRLLPVFRLAHLERDHGLAVGGGKVHGGHKLCAILDALQQGHDHLDVGSIGHVVDEVGHLQVHLVTGRGPQADADAPVHGLHHVASQSAALRGQADGPLDQIVRERGREGQAQAMVDVGEAWAVGAIQAHAARIGNLFEPHLGAFAFFAGLPKT